MKSISAIKEEFNELTKVNIESYEPLFNDFYETHKDDQRKGVVQILNRGKKMIKDYVEELDRIDFMLTYEKAYKGQGFIGGVDEAGRGPLAGPVVAACVILNPEDPILYVNDSKKLNAKMRDRLFDEIQNRALSFGIGIVHHDRIDEINILQATYEAMRIAIEQMEIKPVHLLNDAVIIPGVSQSQDRIIKGDAKSLSIAAASILAKVTRDRIMVAYDELYPEYGFAGHKGYGSSSHIEAIRTFGPSPIHRSTFIKNFV